MVLFLNVYATPRSGGGRGRGRQDVRERLRDAIDRAFPTMPREAQRAFERTVTLLRNNSGGIVAGGNRTTTVTVSRRGFGIPRDRNRR